MKFKYFTALLVVIFTMSACTQLGGSRFKRSYISIKDAKQETVGTLFVWEADASAAVLFKDGGACMQTALAIKTANMKAEAKLSDAILNLSETANKVADNSKDVSSSALADVSASIKEAASMLTTTTERTAFLNVGMFYICQVAANKSLTPEQTNALINSLITSASAMTKL